MLLEKFGLPHLSSAIFSSPNVFVFSLIQA